MQSLHARWPVATGVRRACASGRPGASPSSPLLRAPRRAAAGSGAGGAEPTATATATTTTTTTPPQSAAALSTADFEENATPPPGCSRYTVNIKKPLGLVFEQDTKTLVVRVAELSPDGAAERAGVGIGDQLLATSGVVYGATEEYGEVQVKKQQARVRLSARGETLKTIGAAISSHPGAWDVTLEFQRCEK